jgi:hypothetical protein
MPLDWTKLNTIFKKANKRYPNVPAIDGDPKSHTSALLEIKEALDIAQRRSGDIKDSFVRVGELDALGLFDNQYAGKNLGHGKGIYKRTDESTTLKYHELRSLVAGDGITLTQSPTEITIAAGNGTLSQGSVTYSGSISVRCGATSTSFTPSVDCPDAQEGDLCVWVIIYGSAIGSPCYYGASIDIPSGWSCIKPDGYAADIFQQGSQVLYKFMSAADLNTTFTCSKIESITKICSTAYFFSNVHPDMPFTGSIAYQRTKGYQNNAQIRVGVPVFAEEQYVLQVAGLSECTEWPYSNNDFPMSVNALSQGELNLNSFIDNNTSVYRSYHVCTIPASISNDENLVPYETLLDSIADEAGWAYVNCIKTARTSGTYKTILTATGTGEHYVEKEFTLLEGTWYTAATLSYMANGTGSWLSIIDPDGLERGALLCQAGLTQFSVAWQYGSVDDTADYGTNWTAVPVLANSSGIPDSAGGWNALWFKCRKGGVHKVRIYIYDRASQAYTEADRSFTAQSTNDRIEITHVLLRSSRAAPYIVWTPNGETVAAQSLSQAICGWLDASKVPPNGYTHAGFAITTAPAWETFPLCRMVGEGPVANLSGFSTFNADGSQLCITPALSTTGERQTSFAADRFIYPYQRATDVARAKYYFEVTFNEIDVDYGSKYARVGVKYAGQWPAGSMAINSDAGIWWDITNSCIRDLTGAAVKSSVAVSEGDVIGVAVDFDAMTVAFYQNGVLVHTVTNPANYPGGSPNRDSGIPKSAPMLAFAGSGITTNGITVRLKAPFTYTVPDGHVEYDWLGAIGTSAYLPSRDATGGGAVVLYTDNTGAEMQRTLVGGDGITVTQYTDNITIDAIPYTVANQGAGAGVYQTMSAQEIRLRSIVAGTGITVTQNADNITITASGGVTYLNDLSDVDDLYPNTNDVLTWDGSKWTALAPTGGGGGGGASYLNDLVDVLEPYPNRGDHLTWDGYNWVGEVPSSLTGRFGFKLDSAGNPCVTLSYDKTTRKVTATATLAASTFTFYHNGVEHVETSPWVSAAHDATTGDHFLYHDGTHFVWSTTPWDIMTTAQIALVFYNATLSDGVVYNEMHTVSKDPGIHRNLHATVGTQLSEGGVLGDYTPLTDTDAATRFSITAATIYDEDLKTTTSALADAGPYTIWRREDGATGAWTWTTGNGMPYLYGTYPKYNKYAAGAWSMADITNNYYVNYYVICCPTPTAAQQFILIPGQSEYSTLAAAQAASFANLSLGNFPWPEFVVVAKITYLGKTSHSTTGKGQIAEVTRLIGSRQSVSIAGASGSHNALGGLQGGTASEYYHLTAAQIANLPATPIRRTLGATWGNSSALTAPAANIDVVVPSACTIKGVRIYTTGGNGSCVVDIWKSNHAGFPALDADSITAAAVPTITAAAKYSDDTLTGWTTALAAGDVLRFNLDSTSTFTRISIFLIVE